MTLMGAKSPRWTIVWLPILGIVGAISLALIGAQSGNAPTGMRDVGLLRELQLPAPVMMTTGDPYPARLYTLQEAATRGVWIPDWVPEGATTPTAALYYTEDGDQVSQITFQVERVGVDYPEQVVIVQLDGSAMDPLAFRPVSGVDARQYGSVAMAEQVTEMAPSIRPAEVAPALVHQWPGETLTITSTDTAPALHGLRWRTGTTQFYVGGTVSMEEIRQIAERLRHP
jgi:hypothetical protein